MMIVILMMIIMIMMIVIMMMIIMIIMIILYTFLFSSLSSHVPCFQEWHCEKCYMIFNYERNCHYHMKCCSSLNKYRCEKCGNVYNRKKSLHGHKRKQRADEVCHFTLFVWRICTISISHIYYEDVQCKLYYREQEMRVMKIP